MKLAYDSKEKTLTLVVENIDLDNTWASDGGQGVMDMVTTSSGFQDSTVVHKGRNFRFSFLGGFTNAERKAAKAAASRAAKKAAKG